MSTNIIVKNYIALSQSSPKSDVSSALQRLIDTPLDSFSASEKETIVRALLDDLRDTTGRISPNETTLALSALKTLGRHPTSSKIIVQTENLQLLLGIGTDSRDQQADSAQEALRCIANALLLIESSRDSLLSLQGGEACVRLLERTTNPDFIFLSSRLLFLMTVSETPFISKLVEELRIIDILGQKCDFLLTSLLSGHPMAKDAMVDFLKFIFNILWRYPRMTEPEDKEDTKASPKVMGELWNDNLSGILPPLLRLFNGLPPTFPCPLSPPLTHVVHNLINIPIGPLASQWFSPTSTPTSTSTSSLSRLPTAEKFHKTLSALATTVTTSGRRSLSSSRPSSPAAATPRLTTPPTPRDTVQHAWDIFDVTTAHYVPNDPDDSSVRQLCKQEGVSLDELLPPLVVLLTRLADGNTAARLRMKEWLLPADLDRTVQLEQREDLLGRCLRLMSSVYFPRCKDIVGELLFVICESDASILASQVGYGNCAGFLFNKGIMAPPTGLTDAQGEAINPITGIRNKPRDDDEIEMTEEEKEREAEKLFVLFDRLEKKGMVVNPVRKAFQDGGA